VAEQWRLAYWRLVRENQARDQLGLGPRPVRIARAVKSHLTRRRNTVSPATWQNDRSALGHLVKAVPRQTTTASLTPGHLSRLFDKLLTDEYRPTTLRTYLGSIRVFCDTFGRADLTDAVELPDPGRADVVTLDSVEMQRLKMTAERLDCQRIGRFPSARLAVEIGLSMGLRQGEIFALKWEDLRPESRSVRVQYQVPKDRTTLSPLKGRLGRTALILPGWWDVHSPGLGLICGREGRPVGSRTQRNLITRVLDSSGLNRQGLGWHVLRHTYSRLCLEDYGVSLEELQRYLGHSSIRTTEQSYGHFRTDVAVERGVRKVYGG